MANRITPQSRDPIINSLAGVYGVDVFTNPSSETGHWIKVVAKGAVSGVTLVSNWSSSPSTMADGEVVYGLITSISATGTVYAYRTAKAQS